MVWDFTQAQTQLIDTRVLVHTCVCMGVRLEFLLIYMTNIISFIYISVKRLPKALGCLLFLSRDTGQEAKNSRRFSRLRRTMLTCIPAKLLVHRLCLSRQRLHGTDSELFSQDRGYNLAVAA